MEVTAKECLVAWVNQMSLVEPVYDLRSLWQSEAFMKLASLIDPDLEMPNKTDPLMKLLFLKTFFEEHTSSEVMISSCDPDDAEIAKIGFVLLTICLLSGARNLVCESALQLNTSLQAETQRMIEQTLPLVGVLPEELKPSLENSLEELQRSTEDVPHEDGHGPHQNCTPSSSQKSSTCTSNFSPEQTRLQPVLESVDYSSEADSTPRRSRHDLRHETSPQQDAVSPMRQLMRSPSMNAMVLVHEKDMQIKNLERMLSTERLQREDMEEDYKKAVEEIDAQREELKELITLRVQVASLRTDREWMETEYDVKDREQEQVSCKCLELKEQLADVRQQLEEAQHEKLDLEEDLQQQNKEVEKLKSYFSAFEKLEFDAQRLAHLNEELEEELRTSRSTMAKAAEENQIQKRNLDELMQPEAERNNRRSSVCEGENLLMVLLKDENKRLKQEVSDTRLACQQTKKEMEAAKRKLLTETNIMRKELQAVERHLADKMDVLVAERQTTMRLRGERERLQLKFDHAAETVNSMLQAQLTMLQSHEEEQAARPRNPFEQRQQRHGFHFSDSSVHRTFQRLNRSMEHRHEGVSTHERTLPHTFPHHERRQQRTQPFSQSTSAVSSFGRHEHMSHESVRLATQTSHFHNTLRQPSQNFALFVPPPEDEPEPLMINSNQLVPFPEVGENLHHTTRPSGRSRMPGHSLSTSALLHGRGNFQHLI